MNINKSPCYECEKRKLGCHSNCDKYKEWSNYQYYAKKQGNLQINPRGCTYFKGKVTKYGVFKSKKKFI